MDLSKVLDFCLAGWKNLHSANLKLCFFLQGIKEYSEPVGLDGKARVDLVVVGSVAVSEKGKIKPCKLFRRRVLSHDSQCHCTTPHVPFGRHECVFGTELRA